MNLGLSDGEIAPRFATKGLKAMRLLRSCADYSMLAVINDRHPSRRPSRRPIEMVEQPRAE